MLRIGVFSDDVGGPMTAILIARGLAESGVPVTLAAPPQFPFRDRPRPDVDASPIRVVPLSDGNEGDQLGGVELDGRDLVVTLGLAALRDSAAASQIDVAVVVGKDHPAASRALRAARCEPCCAAGSPWFLATSNQSVIRTQASILSNGSIPLPFSTRVLPMTLPRLNKSLEDRLLEGECMDECRRAGILLAALVTAASAMQTAVRIDADDLTGLMARRADGAERDVGRRLQRLACAFERLAPEEIPQAARERGTRARRREGERWHPARAVINPNGGRPSAVWMRKPS
jgi:hypothetical protein